MEAQANLVGRIVAKLRYQRGWGQEELVSQLQRVGYLFTRSVVANIETLRSPVTDKMLGAFVKVYRVDIKELFPPDVLSLDNEVPIVGLAKEPHTRRRRRRRLARRRARLRGRQRACRRPATRPRRALR